MSSSAPVLSLSNVVFSWDRHAHPIQIPNLVLDRGEKVLVLGPSGSGKSTMLGLVYGTLVPHSGRVTVAGQDMTALSARRRDGVRAEHVGVIFQQFNLIPHASALDNVLLALRFAPQRRKRTPDPEDAARNMLADLGLPETDACRSAGQLSVGQQQRVAAARALIGSPELLVADEPTSSLDRANQNRFMDLVLSQAQQQGSSILLVSHDERLAKHFDRVIEMASGQSEDHMSC